MNFFTLFSYVVHSSGKSVFLWNATTRTATPLMELEGETEVVTAVKWDSDGTHVAIGTSKHEVLLWDVARQQCVSQLHT